MKWNKIKENGIKSRELYKKYQFFLSKCVKTNMFLSEKFPPGLFPFLSFFFDQIKNVKEEGKIRKNEKYKRKNEGKNRELHYFWYN